MYLFIFESIGTQELVLIAIVALMIFGPRKLPELAKMAGKAMNEFRRATNDFKSTWEREVNLESLDETPQTRTNSIAKNELNINGLSNGNNSMSEPSIIESTVTDNSSVVAPQIREVNQTELPKTPSQAAKSGEKLSASKKDWF